jgi:vacuolar-type H+-ATPase subunit I/STV1
MVSFRALYKGKYQMSLKSDAVVDMVKSKFKKRMLELEDEDKRLEQIVEAQLNSILSIDPELSELLKRDDDLKQFMAEKRKELIAERRKRIKDDIAELDATMSLVI